MSDECNISTEHKCPEHQINYPAPLEISDNHPPTTIHQHSDKSDIQAYNVPINKETQEGNKETQDSKDTQAFFQTNNLGDISESDRVIIITGGTSGLGYQCCLKYIQKGWKVILTGPDKPFLDNAVDELKKFNDGRYQQSVYGFILDLGNRKSIVNFLNNVSSLKKIDILLNNAATQAYEYHETVDGHELNMGINYIGHFILTLHLLQQLENAQDPQILSIVCKFPSDLKFNSRCLPVFKMIGQKPFDAKLEYQRSKLALVSFTTSLNAKLEHSNTKFNVKYKTRVNCIDPGVMRDTHIERNHPKSVLSQFTMAPPIFSIKSSDGAEFVCRMLEQKNLNGKYWFKDREAKTPLFVLNNQSLNHLWKNTIAMTEMENIENQFFNTDQGRTIPQTSYPKSNVFSEEEKPPQNSNQEAILDRLDKLSDKLELCLGLLSKLTKEQKKPMEIQQ